MVLVLVALCFCCNLQWCNGKLAHRSFFVRGCSTQCSNYVVIGMETLILSSRSHAWFAHVVPNRRVSFRVSRYPSCILLTCVFVRSGAFFGIDVGSWTFLAHGRSVSAAGKHGRRERESQQRVHSQNTNSHMTLSGKQAQHHTPIRCVA